MTSDPRSGACWKCHRIHTSADPCPHVNTRLGEHSEADAVALTPQEAIRALLDAAKVAAVKYCRPSVLLAAPSHSGADLLAALDAAGFVLARKAGA